VSLTVRIARGLCLVEGLESPISVVQNRWNQDGSFEIDTFPGEHLRELEVAITGGVTDRGAWVSYKAVLTSRTEDEG
jgi:hypothetical protein